VIEAKFAIGSQSSYDVRLASSAFVPATQSAAEVVVDEVRCGITPSCRSVGFMAPSVSSC